MAEPGAHAHPPDFVRSVNPISTRGYAPPTHFYFPSHKFRPCAIPDMNKQILSTCVRPVVPGGAEVPWHPQILADQLTLSQPRGVDYAHQIILATPPGFSDLPTALVIH